MKTLLKLIVAAVVVNAAFHGGSAYLKYYQFKVSYTENVEVFPRYFYPVSFSFNAEAYGVPGATPPPRPRPRSK